jgi:hypothetical protein
LAIADTLNLRFSERPIQGGIDLSTIRAGATTLVAAALFAFALGGATATADVAPRADKKPAIFDLFGGKMVEPETIFLTANSGPYLDELVWSEWGKSGASGAGTYVSECASCGPPERLDVVVEAKRADRCKKKGGKAFRTVKYTVTRADGSEATRKYPAGFSVYCKK